MAVPRSRRSSGRKGCSASPSGSRREMARASCWRGSGVETAQSLPNASAPPARTMLANGYMPAPARAETKGTVISATYAARRAQRVAHGPVADRVDVDAEALGVAQAHEPLEIRLVVHVQAVLAGRAAGGV